MAQIPVTERDRIVDQLLGSNPEFRRLHRNHQTLKEQLAHFDRRGFLSADEEMERKRLQKQKLLEKDRMEELVRSHFHSQGASAA